MSFAALPSSPGFQAPQAPSWEPFALQANQNIVHGGDMRAAAGKEFADSISKAADQITGILQYNSPLFRAQRANQMRQQQYLTGLYNEFDQHPEKFMMTANGPVMINPFQQALAVSRYNNAQTAGELNKTKLKNANQLDQQLGQLNSARHQFENDDVSGLPVKSNTENAPLENQPAQAPEQPVDLTPAADASQDVNLNPIATPEGAGG